MSEHVTKLTKPSSIGGHSDRQRSVAALAWSQSARVVKLPLNPLHSVERVVRLAHAMQYK